MELNEYNLLAVKNLKQKPPTIDTKTRAAFTRTNNKETHALPHADAVKGTKAYKRKGKGGGDMEIVLKWLIRMLRIRCVIELYFILFYCFE